MRRYVWLISLPFLAFMTGCDSSPSATASSKPKIKARETLRKTTQRIYELEPELKKGAIVSDGKVRDYNPISGPGDVYVKTTGQLGTMVVDQAIEMYNASNGYYPKTFQEFMDEIIKVGKPDGIQLPERPYYQEYAYDAANHKLVVLEYPERKKQFQEQKDAEYGR